MRIANPRVLAVELWNLPVAGKLLHEWRDDPAFPIHLAAVVHDLRAGPPSGFPRAIAHVHLLGGGVTDAIADALALHGTTTRSTDPFAAARAGAALYPGALCVDVGQTAIKLVHGDRAWRVDRDLARAPMRDATPLAARPAARTSTVRFLGDLLAGAPGDPIVLALPCELDVHDHPRSCTYCWPDPDPALLAELADAARRPIHHLNDAELAAHAAIPHVPAVTTLVLTVGFSVGGAVVLP